jgi:hypothetical protein
LKLLNRYERIQNGGNRMFELAQIALSSFISGLGILLRGVGFVLVLVVYLAQIAFVCIMRGASALVEFASQVLPEIGIDWEVEDNPLVRALVLAFLGLILTVPFSWTAVAAVVIGAALGIAADPETQWTMPSLPGMEDRPQFPFRL